MMEHDQMTKTALTGLTEKSAVKPSLQHQEMLTRHLGMLLILEKAERHHLASRARNLPRVQSTDLYFPIIDPFFISLQFSISRETVQLSSQSKGFHVDPWKAQQAQPRRINTAQVAGTLARQATLNATSTSARADLSSPHTCRLSLSSQPSPASPLT